MILGRQLANNSSSLRTLAERTPRILGKTALIVLFAFCLLVVGIASALFPQLSVRLAPFLVIGIVFFIAVLAYGNKELSEKFRRWWLTGLLVMFSLWPSYMIFKFGQLPAIDGRRLIVGLSILLTFYLIVSRRSIATRLLHPEPGPLKVGFWIVTVFGLLRLASCFQSDATVYSLTRVAWEVFYYYSMFFISALFFQEERYREYFSRTMMAMIVLIGLYVVGERILQRNLIAEFAPRSLDFEDLSIAMDQGRIRDGKFRAQGTFEHPLVMAEFMSASFCFALSVVLWPRSKIERAIGLIAIIIAPIAIWFSGTRSGLVALAAGFGIVIMLRIFSTQERSGPYARSIRKFAFVTIAGCMVMSLVPLFLSLAEGKSVEENRSTQVRLYMVKLATPVIYESPLLGTGPGTAGAAAGIRTGSGVSTLDSHLLALTIESGVPALIFFVLLFLYPVWVTFNKLMSGTLINPRFTAAVAGALVAVLIFRAIMWIPYNMSIVFIMVALALSACGRKERAISEN